MLRKFKANGSKAVKLAVVPIVKAYSVVRLVLPGLCSSVGLRHGPSW